MHLAALNEVQHALAPPVAGVPLGLGGLRRDELFVAHCSWAVHFRGDATFRADLLLVALGVHQVCCDVRVARHALRLKAAKEERDLDAAVGEHFLHLAFGHRAVVVPPAERVPLVEHLPHLHGPPQAFQETVVHDGLRRDVEVIQDGQRHVLWFNRMPSDDVYPVLIVVLDHPAYVAQLHQRHRPLVRVLNGLGTAPLVAFPQRRPLTRAPPRLLPLPMAQQRTVELLFELVAAGEHL
mmetsp:Transcript_51818/g.133614  ORF Transcript_51818/g.133614 Transcript_51818/m.133614 type:complete len:238 (+) Transcript_51818:1257-1970(+)